ncbi:MAG: aspartate aminotransferase family protein [Thermoprotei archaeon]
MDDLDFSSVLEDLRRRLKPYEGSGKVFSTLPEEGVDREDIFRLLKSYTETENDSWRKGMVSGAVYHGGEDLIKFFEEIYRLYSQTNPLHPDVWPSLTKFTNEIVAMCAGIMNGDDGVRGSVTSGGTESILLAIKTYRDYYKSKKGVSDPEVIIPISAHAAFLKACDYFCLKPVLVELDDNFQVDVEKVKEAVTHNTVAIVGSAPSFPHGIVDPIKELSEVAADRGVGMHVDACLGGFILPWAKKLGYKIPEFDFSLAGVTSISMDTHKYGFAPKGTSVVLYRNSELFDQQLYVTGSWQGGIYFTPTMAGSRPGYPIVAAWAVMLAMGEKGYMEAARRILEVGGYLKAGIKGIPGMRVLGDPLWVIAMSTGDARIYSVLDMMGKRGWVLNGLMNPPAFHIALTMRHTLPGVKEKFLEDLKTSVEEAAKVRGSGVGMAPVYGMASALPEDQVNYFLKNIVEWLYSL